MLEESRHIEDAILAVECSHADVRQDVFAYLKRFDVPRNPLYDEGAMRVGCYPCIMSRKGEIREAAKRSPEKIIQIRTWETKIDSTFFRPGTTPIQFRSKECTTADGRTVMAPMIDDVVRWSNTAHGGKSPYVAPEPTEDEDAGLACPSGMGMCE